jgi:uncharacterized protein DUF6049
VVRPLSLLPALAAAVAMLAGTGSAGALPASDAAEPALAAHAAALRSAARHSHPVRRADDDSPLSVSIDALSPSSIPRKGPIRISGSVTNRDDAPWEGVRVYAFIDDSPMTTSAELAEAVQTDPAAVVGSRITAPGTYDDSIDLIEPGESAQFSLSVRRSQLPVTEPGVYWFGVHALGAGPEGRIDGADGRARTFLPLAPRRARPVDTSLVVPLRRRITFLPDGRLSRIGSWTRTLSPGGRLRSLVDFGVSAGSRPVTWLLDPALPDAVRSLAAGNPPRSLAGDTGDDGNGSTASAEPTPDATGSTAAAQPLPQETIDAATGWLDRLHEGLEGQPVLALPYGDLDLAAAAERRPSLYDRARRRSGTVLEPWGLSMTPAVSSPSGFLNAAGLQTAARRATVLMTDRELGPDAPAVARTAGRRVVATSYGAATGGPGPGDPLAPMALRQRILSEAAVRLLEPGHRPLVVALPSHWNPTVTTGFFGGLDVDWLHLGTLTASTDGRRARPVPLASLDYPARQRRRELDAANFASATSLTKAGQTLGTVLSADDTLTGTVADQALDSLSYASRGHPESARAAVDRSRDWIASQLGSISIQGPRGVTLSSASGRFSATLVNGIDQPVSVAIRATSDEPMEISGPTTVDIAAGGRTTVLLNARTRVLGVHNVTLAVTDADGVPLGSTDVVPIRAARVSAVIWVILGVGVALLFTAIAVRLFRRIRAAARAGQP